MGAQKHKEYTDYIIRSLQTLAPKPGTNSYVYAAGFLAAYLATILEEDPIAFHQFKRHIEQRKKELNSVAKPRL